MNTRTIFFLFTFKALLFWGVSDVQSQVIVDFSSPADSNMFQTFVNLFDITDVDDDSILLKIDPISDGLMGESNDNKIIDTLYYKFIRPNPLFKPYAWRKIKCDFGYIAIICYMQVNDFGDMFYYDMISYDFNGNMIGCLSIPYMSSFFFNNKIISDEGLLYINHSYIKSFIFHDEDLTNHNSKITVKAYDYSIAKNGKLQRNNEPSIIVLSKKRIRTDFAEIISVEYNFFDASNAAE